jgi:murein DD-endopeptidase MepM/ murein hydrolase activator NlpD
MAYSIIPASAVVDEAAGTLTFTVTRSSFSAAETLYLSTTPDQGFSNSGDYGGLLNRIISFSAGQASTTVTLSIFDDALAEGDESFGIILQQRSSDPAGTYLAKTNFTIHDNDAPAPAPAYSIQPAAPVVDEAAGKISFTVTRSSGSAAETLYVSTTPDQGFANAGDYGGLLNRAVSFSAGQTSQTVTLSIYGDDILEGNESFGIIVQRQSSDPASIYLAKSIFTITDGKAPASSPLAVNVYPATGINSIGQGNQDNDDSHAPGGPRQWAYDFLTANGTEVHAVAGGTVVSVRADLTGPLRGYGNVVTILHDGGVYATYGHLTAFSAKVSVGMRIEAGQVIARSGDSGSWDGQALHPNLHIQFGTKASMLNADFSNPATATLIADGSGDAAAPAYFPKLVIDFSHRADTGLSTDSDYMGTFGIDDFTGNDRANSVWGNAGDDILRGNGGADILRGEAGGDTILGGSGSDTITGGSGSDRLSGGTGADIFVFSKDQANGDVITDFEGSGANAGDVLKFAGYGTPSNGARFYQDQADPTHWHIVSADGSVNEVITLNAPVHSSDFVFV